MPTLGGRREGGAVGSPAGRARPAPAAAEFLLSLFEPKVNAALRLTFESYNQDMLQQVLQAKVRFPWDACGLGLGETLPHRTIQTPKEH